MQRALRLVERQRHQQRAAVRQLLGPHPELRDRRPSASTVKYRTSSGLVEPGDPAREAAASPSRTSPRVEPLTTGSSFGVRAPRRRRPGAAAASAAWSVASWKHCAAVLVCSMYEAGERVVRGVEAGVDAVDEERAQRGVGREVGDEQSRRARRPPPRRAAGRAARTRGGGRAGTTSAVASSGDATDQTSDSRSV